MGSLTDLERHEELRMPVTEEAVAEVFDEIDQSYFTKADFDAVQFELAKIPGEEFEMEALEKERFRLKKQLRVVSKKVSGLIAKNSANFCHQVQQHEILREKAGGMIEVISEIREKQRGLRDLKQGIVELKPLVKSYYRVKELIAAGDFPNAIKLCVEARRAADLYCKYNSVQELAKSLSRALGTMEGHIDEALASMTISFNSDKYQLIYHAYKMLGKTQEASQKLQSFFHATIQSSARTVLIELLRRTTDVEDVDSLSYDDMCSAVPLDFVVECVQELGLVVCKVLCIYHSILAFHIEEDKRQFNALEVKEVVDFEGPLVVEKDVGQTVMIEGMSSVFGTAAEKYNSLLAHQDFSHLKVDQFIHVLEMTNRFRRFGRRHFNNPFVELTPTLDKVMSAYFARYHRERMEELRMFLENEVFTLCPVPLQFTLFDLSEFCFLKESSEAFDDDDIHLKRYQREASELSESLNLIETDTDNPFLPLQSNESFIRLEKARRSTSTDRSSSEESCYESQQSGMESSLPNVCNTSLNLLKYFGRYIQMTSMLHSIADQVIQSIIQLYEYMLFTVIDHFGRDADCTVLELNFFTPRLAKTIASVQQNLISDNSEDENSAPNLSRYRRCSRSPCVQLSRENAFALAERIVAVESVIFLAKQLELLHPVLDSLLPPTKKNPVLQNFYKHTLTASFDLREAVYGCVTSKWLKSGTIVKAIKQVKWDINEIEDQHTECADQLFKELSDFNVKLEGLSGEVHLSQEIKSTLWVQIVKTLFKVLVQGYSEVSKKCSNEGRALMLLDLEHLNRYIEGVSGLKPVPYKAHVEDYVKAFYLPDTCLPDWISTHSGKYTAAQVNAVFSFVSQKGKSRIMNIIEGKILENKD